MRRKEKEITNRDEIDRILHEARVCRVAFARENEPYLVPLFYGYDGQSLYLHTAQAGKKLDYVAANDRICFEIELNVELIPHDTRACNWSAHFESVIGTGRMVELLATEEKEYGLNQIMAHYTSQAWDYAPRALQGTRVWRVEIESLTGKRSPPKGD